MKAFILVALLLVLVPSLGRAQTYIDTDSTFRVTYAYFNLTVPQIDTEYIQGSVTLRCVSRGLRADRQIELRLHRTLQVDSIRSGAIASFVHPDDTLYVTVPSAHPVGEVFDVTISYHGYSRTGAFIHAYQVWPPTGEVSSPVIWTSSEPFGARDWWPVKDNPAEKLDSVDMLVRCPPGYTVAANGLLRSVTDHDTSLTYWWHESYPIDHYLVAFSITNYDTVASWHHWADGDSMRMLSYVFPRSVDTMPQALRLLDTILDQYESWFGPYPFRREKYGIAQWHGGGMENQTLSFCNDGDWSLLAHETAHQWFGDGITCKTWNDCWLNEGFATYVTDLFGRRLLGQKWMDTDMFKATEYVIGVPGGLVHPADSTLENIPDDYQRSRRVLDGRFTYAKPGLVLHMLNYVLGSDTAFYRAIREYMMGPQRYGVASTEDLRASVEHSSGMDLKWFFDEWIYEEGYPTYTMTWSEQGSLVAVAITQTGSSPNSPVFKMPIELRFTGDGLDTTVQVWNDRPIQTYPFNLSKPAGLITFDPHSWLIDSVRVRSLGVESVSDNRFGLTIARESGGLYRFSFSLASAAKVGLEIYDELGRRVETLDSRTVSSGPQSIDWLPRGLASGAYFCKLIAGSTVSLLPFVLVP